VVLGGSAGDLGSLVDGIGIFGPGRGVLIPVETGFHQPHPADLFGFQKFGEFISVIRFGIPKLIADDGCFLFDLPDIGTI
jgi:hypothetical protein